MISCSVPTKDNVRLQDQDIIRIGDYTRVRLQRRVKRPMIFEVEKQKHFKMFYALRAALEQSLYLFDSAQAQYSKIKTH